MTTLEYFSSEAEMASVLDNPDAAVERLDELAAEDWVALQGLWDKRDTAWREAMMFFGGLVELEWSFGLLALGLADTNPIIYLEAALSIADALEDGDDYPVPAEAMQRLKVIAATEAGRDFDELQRFL